MKGTYDVIVAGGGPAGATTALCLARRKWRVALLEPSSFDGERYGETLPPEINPVLRELGLAQTFESLKPVEAPGIVSVWGDSVPAYVDFIRNPCGSGWHIDRNRFDAMICGEAVSAGAVLFRGRRAHQCFREDGYWRVGEISAPILVNASGRNGLATGRSRELEMHDRLLAIVLRVPWVANKQPDLRTYIEAAPLGWWYTAPLPTGRIIAMFFTDKHSYARGSLSLEDQLREAPLTRSRLGSTRDSNRRVVSAPSFRARRIVGEDLILVGDSASTYDPLSGRGIFKALSHATALAAALDRSLRGDHGGMAQYELRVRDEFTAYARQRWQYYDMENRWSDSTFWRARRNIATNP